MQVCLQVNTETITQTDQILVPYSIWNLCSTRTQSQDKPVFVSVNNTNTVARLVPELKGLAGDACAIPEWLFFQSDCCEWIEFSVIPLKKVDRMVLRAHREADLTESADPVTMLTESLEGWTCLSSGQTLHLLCGSFDVMELWSESKTEMMSGCILDCDVKVEFVEALDHVAPPPPPPPLPLPSIQPPPPPIKPPAPEKFQPFTGVGRRLCD